MSSIERGGKIEGGGYTEATIVVCKGVPDINAFPSRIAALFTFAALLMLSIPAFAKPQRAAVDPRYYDYDAHAPFAVTVQPYAVMEGITVRRVTFPSPVVTPYPVNNLVTGFLFLPNTPGPHPVLLVEHEWLPTTMQTEFQMSTHVAQAGITAFLIVQPYSYTRRLTPRLPDVELLSGDVPQMVGALRQGVLDARRAMDWLSTRPDIDASRMGISGISLGGVLAPLIAGVDRRAKVLVTIVGGTDVADVVFDSFITSGLHPSLLYHGVTLESLKRDMAPVEPANWLQGFDPHNALLFNGRFDVFISPKEAHHLSEALGGAPIVWTPTGHYGTVFAQKQIEATGIKFLRARFGLDPAPYTPPSSLYAPTIKIGILGGGQEGVSPALARQFLTFGPNDRLSLDGQITLHGLALAPSVRLDESNSLGLEVPLLHGRPKLRPFYFFHFVL